MQGLPELGAYPHVQRLGSSAVPAVTGDDRTEGIGRSKDRSLAERRSRLHSRAADKVAAGRDHPGRISNRTGLTSVAPRALRAGTAEPRIRRHHRARGRILRLSLFGCADAAHHSRAKRDARFQVSHAKPTAIPAGGIASATMPRLSAPTALSCWKAAVSRHIEQPCADPGGGAASNSPAASARVRKTQRITAADPARESCPGKSSRTSQRCKSPRGRSRSWSGAGGRNAGA